MQMTLGSLYQGRLVTSVDWLLFLRVSVVVHCICWCTEWSPLQRHVLSECNPRACMSLVLSEFHIWDNCFPLRKTWQRIVYTMYHARWYSVFWGKGQQWLKSFLEGLVEKMRSEWGMDWPKVGVTWKYLKENKRKETSKSHKGRRDFALHFA